MSMDVELMNSYIQKQNKLIGELVNKNLMLDAQLEVANKRIASLEAKIPTDTEEQAYK